MKLIEQPIISYFLLFPTCRKIWNKDNVDKSNVNEENMCTSLSISNKKSHTVSIVIP